MSIVTALNKDIKAFEAVAPATAPRIAGFENVNTSSCGKGTRLTPLADRFMLLIGDLGAGLRRAGERLGQLGLRRRQSRARRSLVKGLLELAEGRWQSAERWLIRDAVDSDTPLLNYLAAARAASQLGATERRDRYLAKAHETTPEADIAIGLNQAEEQFAAGQYEQCLAILQHLHHLDAKHPHLLQMLLRVHRALNNSAAQLELLPQLRRRKLLPESELARIERDCFQELLAETRDAAAAWSRIPKALQQDAALVAQYACLLHDQGSEQEALNLLQNALRRRWDSDLVALYGRLATRDLDAHLAVARRWLRRHGEDPALLLTLARLHQRAGEHDHSVEYYQRAIALNPTAEARRDFGRLLETAGDGAAALQQFRSALEQLVPAGAQRPALTAPGAPAEHPRRAL